jgi:hypothetical protein
LFLASHSKHTLLASSTNNFIKVYDVITLAQTIVGNGVIIASPHDYVIHHIGKTKYRKSRTTTLIGLNWHDIHKNSSSNFRFTTGVQTDTTRVEIHQGGVRHQWR